jgi:glutaminase
MINAGAIASTGLVRGKDAAERIARIVDLCSRCAGRELEIDENVYRSERETGFRNFAIGYMLRNFSILDSAPEPILEAYFRQCSILVSCRDLAVMAATLANAGVCPLTGETAVQAHCIPQVLSVMASCGMYDYAGEWIYRIGMPSKSGVGGGIIGVLPGQMAVAVFSPPLDARGNSVRAIRVFNDLSDELRLHMFGGEKLTAQVLRRKYDAGTVSSKRLRRAAEMRVLRAHGDCIAVYELQGQLTLFSIERIVRELLALPERVEYLVVDFRRVLGAEAPALDLWLSYLEENRGRHEAVYLCDFEHCPPLGERLSNDANGSNARGYACAVEADAALEVCENRLLSRMIEPSAPERSFPLEKFEVCDGLEPERVEVLRQVLERRGYAAGDIIIRKGDAANYLFFLIEGRVSVSIDLPDGTAHRLATCTPGMLFGEMAIVERRPRSAAVTADTAVECYAMSVATFDRLTATHPDLKVKLLENFAHSLSVRLRQLTDEVRVLSE